MSEEGHEVDRRIGCLLVEFDRCLAAFDRSVEGPSTGAQQIEGLAKPAGDFHEPRARVETTCVGCGVAKISVLRLYVRDCALLSAGMLTSRHEQTVPHSRE